MTEANSTADFALVSSVAVIRTLASMHLELAWLNDWDPVGRFIDNAYGLRWIGLLWAPVLLTLANPAIGADPEVKTTVYELHRFEIPEAHQAVAVDANSFYAISNRSIGQYEKSSGKGQAKWNAPEGSPIRHLNSGVVVNGRLYCANSNWPQAPLKNSIEIFATDNFRHLERKDFPETEGAINWIDRHQGAWWIVFAFYGEEHVRRTRLVRYDDEWKITGTWSFPETVVQRFLPNSNSGGGFGPNGRLYVTGHDHAELYALEIPKTGSQLKHVETIQAPIAGQGIAWDRSDIGTLYGIIRKRKSVVAMRLSHSLEYTKLKQPVEWERDTRNPILAPRPAISKVKDPSDKPTGYFDATRCMNPWVVRVNDQYRLFYSGGDKAGRQRIGVAQAKVDQLDNWKRSDPLFELGAAGAFDARWCVLPHVVQLQDKSWRLYYTGNAGRGSGLSAFPGMGIANSRDGVKWSRSNGQAVLALSGQHGDPDAVGIAGGSVIQVRAKDGTQQWRFYYTGCPTIGKPHALNQQKTICLAVSHDGVKWTKRGAVMLRDLKRDYEDIGVAGPVVHQQPDGSFRMWYSAIGTRSGYYSICYAESDDGVHWRRGLKAGDNLQLTPTGDGWESQMVEYPSVIQEGNRLRLFYCGDGYGKTGIGTAVSKPTP